MSAVKKSRARKVVLPPKPPRQEPAAAEEAKEPDRAPALALMEELFKRKPVKLFDVNSVEITKNEAELLLELLPPYQRTWSPLYSKRLTADIDEGHFVGGIPTIDFGPKGDLDNGQHIFHGFINSKEKKLIFTVRRFYDENAFKVIDEGKKRGNEILLKAYGITKNEVGGMLRALVQHFHGHFDGNGYHAARGSDKMATKSQMAEAIMRLPDIQNYVLERKHAFRGRGLSISGVNAGIYLVHQNDPELTMCGKFFERFLKGDHCSGGDPAKVLRNEFLTWNTRGKPRTEPGEALARIIKAWELFKRGESVPQGTPLLGKKEPYPTLTPMPERAKGAGR